MSTVAQVDIRNGLFSREGKPEGNLRGYSGVSRLILVDKMHPSCKVSSDLEKAVEQLAELLATPIGETPDPREFRQQVLDKTVSHFKSLLIRLAVKPIVSVTCAGDMRSFFRTSQTVWQSPVGSGLMLRRCIEGQMEKGGSTMTHILHHSIS